MTNRRAFMSLLAGSTAALALDPERLLWRPGAKLISVPSETVFVPPVPVIAPQKVSDLLDELARALDFTWRVDPTSEHIVFARPGTPVKGYSLSPWHELRYAVSLRNPNEFAISIVDMVRALKEG